MLISTTLAGLYDVGIGLGATATRCTSSLDLLCQA